MGGGAPQGEARHTSKRSCEQRKARHKEGRCRAEGARW